MVTTILTKLEFTMFWHCSEDDFYHLTIRCGSTHLVSVPIASPQHAISSLNPCEFKRVICVHTSNDLRFIQRPMQMRRNQIKGADKLLEGHCRRHPFLFQTFTNYKECVWFFTNFIYNEIGNSGLESWPS